MGKKTTVDVLVEGGKASAGPGLGGTLGPLKVNIGQVVSTINEKTKDFKNMKVPVKVIVDTETKEFEITIGTPPASQLIMKEIGIEKGSGEPNINKVGVISIEQVIKVAKMKHSSLIINNLKSAVKTIVGSCQSLGILVEGKSSKEIINEINDGKYDEIINSERTEIPEAKRKELDILAKELSAKTKKRMEEKVAAKAQADAEAAKKAAETAPQQTAQSEEKKPAAPAKK